MCNSKLCKLMGIVDHTKGQYGDGFHAGLKTMYNYFLKNQVTRPKIEWVKNKIFEECYKRTKAIQPLITTCSKNDYCDTCAERIKVIDMLLGVKESDQSPKEE